MNPALNGKVLPPSILEKVLRQPPKQKNEGGVPKNCADQIFAVVNAVDKVLQVVTDAGLKEIRAIITGLVVEDINAYAVQSESPFM